MTLSDIAFWLALAGIAAVLILCIFANAYRKARDNALYDEAYGEIINLPSFKHDDGRYQ